MTTLGSLVPVYVYSNDDVGSDPVVQPSSKLGGPNHAVLQDDLNKFEQELRDRRRNPLKILEYQR